MKCRTCAHKLECITRAFGWFWCPGCGTCFHSPTKESRLPKLVEKCRTFRKCLGAEHMTQHQSCRDEWNAEGGIAESINTPANR